MMPRRALLIHLVAVLLGGAITMQRQKPAASTRDFGGEDRGAMARHLRWLKDLPPEVAVIVSHDQAAIAGLIARGVLHDGFDLNDR
jgi:hypothetical protein